MEFRLKTGQAGKQKTACAIVGVYIKKQLSAPAKDIDKAHGRLISAACRRGDISGKKGEWVLLPNPTKSGPSRVLVIGCGNKSKFDAKTYKQLIQAAIKQASQTGSKDAICYLGSDLESIYSVTRNGVEAASDALYRFEQLKTNTVPKPALKTLAFACEQPQKSEAESGIRHGQAIASGVAFARELGNLPSNVCTPTYLATQAKDLAKRYKNINTKVLNRAQAEKKGMHSYLSVSAGAHEPPQFIVMEYSGDNKGSAPIALVGKGITFDTGGISMKPAFGMDEMKFDMCGAAGVLGTMLTIARLRVPCNVVALIPACANMPGGGATNPGDIIKTLSGKTVEILNTDAEGRLILCDALTYAQEFKPRAIIDVATLTGACVIALGHFLTGLMSTNEQLADDLLAAGKQALDPAWRLPLAEEYENQLKSNFADFANVGNRSGGAITAACFLSKFTRNQKWAHLDVAGTAWQSGKNKGATGRPVPLLTQYLLNLST